METIIIVILFVIVISVILIFQEKILFVFATTNLTIKSIRAIQHLWLEFPSTEMLREEARERILKSNDALVKNVLEYYDYIQRTYVDTSNNVTCTKDEHRLIAADALITIMTQLEPDALRFFSCTEKSLSWKQLEYAWPVYVEHLNDADKARFIHFRDTGVVERTKITDAIEKCVDGLQEVSALIHDNPDLKEILNGLATTTCKDLHDIMTMIDVEFIQKIPRGGKGRRKQKPSPSTEHVYS